MAKDLETKKAVETCYGLGVSTASGINDFAIEKRTKQILRHISFEGKSVLDVGCGNGLYILAIDKLAKKSVGVDINQEALKEAIRNKSELNGDTVFIEAAAENLPLPDLTFDVALLVEMLEHVQSEERALEEANRVLKNGGYLVLYVPNKLYLFDEHGIRIGQREFHGVYGGSIPFFSWCPQALRSRFERARICTRGRIVRLVEKFDFDVIHIDYMYPPLDRLRGEFIKGVLRKTTSVLERNYLLRKFGMSIFIVAQKKKS